MLIGAASCLITMKVFGSLGWSWWAVLIPLYPFIVLCAAFAFLFTLLGIAKFIAK
jgi:hypothetical protein